MGRYILGLSFSLVETNRFVLEDVWIKAEEVCLIQVFVLIEANGCMRIDILITSSITKMEMSHHH